MKIDSKIANKNQKNYLIIFLLISTVTLISLKWLTSYLFFPSEPLLSKVIFDLEDHLYFPYILNLSNFNFSPDYLINYTPNKIIPIPIYSLVFHSLSYLIFNEFSFVILEYFSLFLFLYIFSKIFKELNINIYFSILFAFFVFLLPEFLIYFKQLKINLINFDIIKSLYSFRIPRPLISSIYFFWGLLLAIYYYKYKNKNFVFILIGINLALNFGSVYYNFVVLSILFLILFIIKLLDNNKIFFLYSIKKGFIILIFFLIFSLPFVIILFFAEKDWLLRNGAFYPNADQKIIILNYILLKFLSLKFLLIFFVNTAFLFFLVKKQHFFCPKTIFVIYLLFISSCISPILFILFSPTLTELYHFIDLIVVIGILVSFIFFTLIVFIFIKKNIETSEYNKFILKNTFYSLLIFLFLPIIFNLNYYLNYKKNSNPDFRKDINILHSVLDQNNNKELNNILTFNSRIQVWWLLLGNKKLSTINSLLTPLKTKDTELNFINNLKFLNISEKSFYDLISNKKSSWRLDNDHIKYFSFYKYQANSAVTYNNSKNFKKDELNFIKKSSPLYAQQIAIPNEEIKRLIKLFNNTDNLFFELPDIIILEKNSSISKYSSVNLDKYCVLKTTKYLDVYLNLEKANCDILL